MDMQSIMESKRMPVHVSERLPQSAHILSVHLGIHSQFNARSICQVLFGCDHEALFVVLTICTGRSKICFSNSLSYPEVSRVRLSTDGRPAGVTHDSSACTVRTLKNR